MVKLYFLILVIFMNLLYFSGCSIPGNSNSDLNEEFTLSFGKMVTISTENLELKFKDVIEDSRCPKGAICVWQGRVICEIEIGQLGHRNEILLTQSGLMSEFTNEQHGIYNFLFKVDPYPQTGKHINKTQYRLRMIVEKLIDLSNDISSILSKPQSFNGKEITIIGYFRGWDLLKEAQTMPPVTRSDWVIRDATGAIYVSANSEAHLPQGLNPSSIDGVYTVLEVKGTVQLSEKGQPYIFARSIKMVP